MLMSQHPDTVRICRLPREGRRHSWTVQRGAPELGCARESGVTATRNSLCLLSVDMALGSSPSRLRTGQDKSPARGCWARSRQGTRRFTEVTLAAAKVPQNLTENETAVGLWGGPETEPGRAAGAGGLVCLAPMFPRFPRLLCGSVCHRPSVPSVFALQLGAGCAL